MDATERVIRDEGYAAVSSRRVAEVAEIQQGLVYYYFESMDDLLIATFQRRTTRGLARYQQDACSKNPVAALWKDLNEGVDARMGFAFVSLASHDDNVREIYVRFLSEARWLQAETIASDATARGIDLSPASPMALAFILHCTSLVMAREAALGMTEGHDEVHALLSLLLDKFS
ncbi:MAG: helix-turn-helix domain-containing protein [Novosphingobium sp.]